MKQKLTKVVRHVVVRRAIDIILIGIMVYAGLLAFGVVRRGGRLTPGTAAPDVTVKRIADNREVRLTDLQGKPVVLNFFSTSCPSCRRELPDLAELQAEAGPRLQVMVVSTDPPAHLAEYLGREGIDLAAFWDGGQAHEAFGVDTIPYLVVLDGQGRIQGDYIGSLKWADVEPYL